MQAASDFVFKNAWLSRYPAWLERRHRLIVILVLVVSVAGGIVASTLPLRTEFSWLLPDQQPSVVALRQLTARKVASAVIEVGVSSPSPAITQRFAHDLATALRNRVPAHLLRDIDESDAPVQTFIWNHRFLYATLDELERVRTVLSARLQKVNPLFVDLDEDAGSTGDLHELDDLRQRFAAARGRVEHPSGFFAEEGRLRMLVLRCPFGDTEPEKGREVLQAVEQVIRDLNPASYDPQLEVGYAGDPVTAAYEHHLILRDVAVSSLLCVALVVAALFLALRVPQAVAALCLTLLVGCAVTFGLTRFLVGHLNSSTAFLGSVVAGNGINFGIILAWRYLEERRGGQAHSAGLRQALQATAVPTAVAALAAGTSYLSLAITSFRGFSEFGIIAGTGMVVCWVASYLLLPALLTAFERVRPLRGKATRLPAPGTGTLGAVGRRARPARAALVAVVAVTGALSIYGGWRLVRDPFENDLRKMRSRSFAHSAPGRWSRRLDAAFGRDQSGGFYIGAARSEDIPVIVQAVRAIEADVPKSQRMFGKIDALSEVLPGSPAVQADKIHRLGELNRLGDKLLNYLEPDSDDARTLREALPPPAGTIKPVGFSDLPEALRQAFTEADGRVGLLMAIHPGPGFEGWSYRSIRHVVELLRSLPLPPEIARTVQISGGEVIFADMMAAVNRDGPRASVLALVLVLVLLVVAFGRSRDTLITAAALFFALFGMLGSMALLGLRLNFLNFIAIPITAGIGIDYAVNVMARARLERRSPTPLRWALAQTAGAVTLCSATTSIGYAVLLFSDTGAIRSFGSAAVLGEVSSVFAAIVAVPSLLVLFGRRLSFPQPVAVSPAVTASSPRAIVVTPPPGSPPGASPASPSSPASPASSSSPASSPSSSSPSSSPPVDDSGSGGGWR